MKRAYWAATSLGPFVENQVVIFEDEDPWVRTGHFIEIKNEWPPNDGRVYVRVDPATGQK